MTRDVWTWQMRLPVLLSLVLGLELSLRTHLKSLALALKVGSLALKPESLALALKVEPLLALILNIFY